MEKATSHQIITLPDPLFDIKNIAHNSSLSRKLVWTHLKAPDGPEYIKLNGKILIRWSTWISYLERKFKVKKDLDKIVDEVVEGLKKQRGR